LKRLGLLADQHHVIDAEARGLGLGDALKRNWRRSLRTLVHRALVLLTQPALAFLLTLLLDQGLRRGRKLLG